MTNLKPNRIDNTAHRWGIVLSGGNGMRLRELIYRQRADYLPKQYMNFIGKRSMLEHTWHRAEKLIPAEKLLTVLTREHLQFDEARRQVGRRLQKCVIIQPENKDTAPGILLPLVHLHKRDPDAVVTLFPSDHFVLEEDLFMRHVECAFKIVESNESRMVVLGVEPTEPDPEYGYILPGGASDDAESGPRNVEMFVEKPSAEAAKEIMTRGALWNTLVLTATCKTLLHVIKRAMSQLYSCFEIVRDAIGRTDEERVTNHVYKNLRCLNFSKGVLEALPLEHRRALFVHSVRGVTWSDWGTGTRLSSTLEQLGKSFASQHGDNHAVQKALRPTPKEAKAGSESRIFGEVFQKRI